MCIPIKNTEGQVVAVTQMINKRAGVFNDEDKELLKAFAAFAEKTISTVQTIPVSASVNKSHAILDKYLPTSAGANMCESV
jgi:hypothetical protein